MPSFTLDSELLDVLTLDGESETPTPPDDEIWYNFFGLQNASIITEYVKISAADPELVERAFPRADGVYAESFQYRRTSLKIKGTVRGTDREDLETNMDLMRKALTKAGATMRLLWAGQARYYDECYPVSINSIFEGREHFHLTFCPFEVEFISLHPYGRLNDRETFDAPFAITASPTNYIFENVGTAPSDPLIYITVTTAGTLSAIEVENSLTGEVLTLSESFMNGDQIIIDGEEKTVMLNGSPMDYTGVFPRLLAGTQMYSLTFTGSGYSLSLSEQHYSRYF